MPGFPCARLPVRFFTANLTLSLRPLLQAARLSGCTRQEPFPQKTAASICILFHFPKNGMLTSCTQNFQFFNSPHPEKTE
jgi:hypothetical protein